MKKYIFRPYDEAFPKLFRDEKNNLKKILGKEDLIDHFGSTAIPGLGGKGIIDIIIALDKDKLKSISKKLETLGYKFGSKGGSKERLFHSKTIKIAGRLRKYHVHVTFKESDEWYNAIAFRDYLNKHPQTVLRYIRIKKLAFEKAKEEGEVYKKIKKPFIDKIAQKALA